MSYKMTSVDIVMADVIVKGKTVAVENQTVDSYSTPVNSMVITKSLEDNWKYKLTHVPTGKVIMGVDTIKQGRELAVKLAEIADWSGQNPKAFGGGKVYLGRAVLDAHKEVIYRNRIPKDHGRR